MIRTGIPAIFFVVIFLLTLVGCHTNPAVPDIDSPNGDFVNTQTAADNGHACLGYYNLAYNPASNQVDVIPIRLADLHLNITSVLNSTMGVSAVIVPGESDPLNGLIVLDISLAHPFGSKPQLSGFDVKGILITPGSLTVGANIFADVDDTILENADGYSRWWNPTEFTTPGMFGYTKGVLGAAPTEVLTASVNPYKYFADILYPQSSLSAVAGEPLDSDNGRGVFKAGSTNTRRYNIRFKMDPGIKIIYGYAIDCSWAAPSPNPPTAIPDDFPIEANQPEPWRIALSEVVNTLYYDSESGTGGGILKMQASVYDWQGQEAGNIKPQIETVRFYAPDLLSGGIDGVYLDENTYRARYLSDFSGLTNVTGAGETLVVCRAGSTDGSTYKQTGAAGPDVFISAYHAVKVQIADPECAADTNNDPGDATELDLVNPTVDQLCAPTDYRDYYNLIVPAHNVLTGSITLYADPEPTKLTLYDGADTLADMTVSGGSATIDLGSLDLKPNIPTPCYDTDRWTGFYIHARAEYYPSGYYTKRGECHTRLFVFQS